MTQEAFDERYNGRRKWEWPRAGDKVKFLGADGDFYPHYVNIIRFAKKNLKVGEIYTVRRCEVYSSWCSVWLEEKGLSDPFFHLQMFEWPVKEEKNEPI